MWRGGTYVLVGLVLAVQSLSVAVATAQVAAQAAPVQATAGGPRFDVAAATDAYLAKVPPDKKARSDAYFEGGYWLLLWDFLWTAAVLLLVLRLGWSAAMRARAERLAGRLWRKLRWLGTGFYWTQLFTVITVLPFPLAVYEGYFREHKYGLATQTFGPWLGDQAKAFGVQLVMYGILLTLLYAVLRRSRNWWLWGSLVSVLFLTFGALIAPVYIFPLFNTFTKLEDQSIRGPILSLARATGIEVDDVYVMDASRQTTRVGANVSGVLGGLPVLMLLLAVYFFVMTPVLNSGTRIEEAEADLFGLNAARQPDGAAEIALKLGEYRKLDPGPLEEMILFDHPSGRSRIEMAMRFKAENLPAGDPSAP